MQKWPDTRFVQFVDGDCVFAAGWLEAAADDLERNERLAIVCGRLLEQYPEASIYNRLCQMEWDGRSARYSFAGASHDADVSLSSYWRHGRHHHGR